MLKLREKISLEEGLENIADKNEHIVRYAIRNYHFSHSDFIHIPFLFYYILDFIGLFIF